MKSIILLFSVIAFCQLSCMQENLEPAIVGDWHGSDPPPTAPKIKREFNGSESSTFTYDAKGRLVKYTFSDGTLENYEYHPDYLERIIFAPDSSFTGIQTFYLNDKGLVIKSDYTGSPGSVTTYEYNDNGQVIKTKNVSPVSTFEGFYTYKDGNVDQVVYKTNGELSYTYKYSYYTDLTNGLSNENWGQMYLGKDNKNLVKSWYGTGKDGNTFSQFAYHYSLDNKGRVIEQQKSGSENSTWFYEY